MSMSPTITANELSTAGRSSTFVPGSSADSAWTLLKDGVRSFNRHGVFSPRDDRCTPEVPSGYYASRSLAALREQRYDEALALALRIDAPDWPLGQIIVAGAAALGGRADLAARAHARLSALDPKIAKSLPEILHRWRVEPALAAELERGVAAAAL